MNFKLTGVRYLELKKRCLSAASERIRRRLVQRIFDRWEPVRALHPLFLGHVDIAYVVAELWQQSYGADLRCFDSSVEQVQTHRYRCGYNYRSDLKNPVISKLHVRLKSENNRRVFST